MASFTLSCKLKRINDLKCFLSNVEERVKTITTKLKWSYDELCQNKSTCQMTDCSVQCEHQVKTNRAEEHEERCRRLKEGYHDEDLFFPDYCGYGSCVVFTPELKQNVLRECSKGSSGVSSHGEKQNKYMPQTSARYDQEFTREEKLALYDYVISNTSSPKVCTDLMSLTFKEEKNEQRTLTPLEIAAAERDAKRRRASYRNKVHTNRKTHTEILREVIKTQMDTLKDDIMDLTKIHNFSEVPASNCSSTDKSYCHRPSTVNLKREDLYCTKPVKKHYKKHYNRYSTEESTSRQDCGSRKQKHKTRRHKRSHSRSRSREKLNSKKHQSHDYSLHRSSGKY